MREPVYLDHNASTPVKPAVRDAMVEVLSATGNPSSIHSFGRSARGTLDHARGQVAAAINATPEDIIFTSGATEADNAALRATPVASVLVSAIEHDAVLQARDDVVQLQVTETGVVDLVALDKALANAPAPALVSVMLANNETGVIQPVAEIVEVAKRHGAYTHCDAAQALSKMPVDLQALGVDMMSLSGHKCGAPAGVGALVVTERLEPSKWQFGGGQEKRRRPGTENLAGIVGFGKAAELADEDLDAFSKLGAMRDQMEAEVKAAVPSVLILSQTADRLPNTSNIVLPGVPAQTQVMSLDLAGYAVSSGSACSSGRVDPSHVVEAMIGDQELAKCALRISAGWNTTADDMAGFTEAYIRMAKRQLEKLAAA
ncbi:MAG: cysteine desulfurase [Alphaproteobacteria bacterium]|nr:cysteine desulfurase [Alphaproteobacteria bacterium SS10]